MYESRHFPFGKGNEAGNLIDEYSNLSDPADAGEDSGITCTSDNRLATYNGQEVSYDADGNMTYGPLDEQMTSYSFDSRNRLTAAGNSIYTYDAESNRIGVNIDGEQYDDIINPHASLSQVLARTAADESQTCYVYGLGLIGEEKQGNYKVYHYDFRGSTVKLTDASGSVTDSFHYDEYGKLTDHTGSSETSFLYNGQYGIMTDGNGLIYMRARYYNPDVHRFVSTDILEGDISDPLSLNRYAYCSNNPITFVDPMGQVPEWMTNSWNSFKQIPSTVSTSCSDTWNNTVPQTIEYLGSDEAQEAYLNTTGAVLGAHVAAFTMAEGAEAVYLVAGGTGAVALEAQGTVNPQVPQNVIGHYPEYVEMSNKLGAKPFSIPINIWNKMTPAEQWIANKKFLDRAIAKGSEFNLATPIDKVRPGSYLQKEIEYLIKQGYKLNSDGTKLVK